MKIVLTFDDGPHLGQRSQTLSIAACLQAAGCVGAFFVQTGVSYRMGRRAGVEMVRQLHEQGHLIGIHTGVPDDAGDHAPYPRRYEEPAWDVNRDGRIRSADDGETALESDLRSARQRILDATGAPARFARATGGYLGAGAVREGIRRIFARLQLTHVCWNIDSHDNMAPRPRAAQVIANLARQIPRQIHRTALVVLFHDINRTTSTNIDAYISAIRRSVQEAGAAAELVTTSQEIESIFSVPWGWDSGSCGPLLDTAPVAVARVR